MLKNSLCISLLFFPILTWSFYEPIRIIAPELNGVTCYDGFICIDDVKQFSKANTLYQETISFLEKEITHLKQKPLIIFCAHEECSEKFGLNRRTAIHLPMGIVASPRAWKSHYIIHELIHELQKQELGILSMHLKPKWFIEGMAYSLSNDPRTELNEPFQNYRVKFDQWLTIVGKENMWQAGKDL